MTILVEGVAGDERSGAADATGPGTVAAMARGGEGGGRPVGLAAVAVLAAGAVVLTVARLVGAAGRGLDISDEGMYLYSADPGARGVAFHNAFGRYTGVLHALVGRDLVRFRVVGVLLLVASAALVGRQAAACAARLRGHPVRWWEAMALVTVTAAGALHYDALGILTPSYNWLNLVGICLAAGAALDLVPAVGVSADLSAGSAGSEVSDPAAAIPPWRWRWASVFAVGVVIATMGKLTSGPLLLGGAALVALTTRSGPWPGRLRPLLRSLPAGVAVVILHALLIDPPAVTVAEVRRGSRLLAALDPDHYSLRAAAGEVGTALWTVVRGAGLGVLPGVVVLLVGRRWVARTRVDSSAVDALALAVALTGASALGAWFGGREGYALVGWNWVAVVATGGVVAIGRRATERRGSARGLLAVAVVGASGGVAYAFGSGNGFFAQSGGAVALFVLPVAVVVTVGRDRAVDRWRGAPLVTLAAGLALAGWSLVAGAAERPYRQAPLAAATVPVDVGPDAGTVRVSPGLASLIADLRERADAAGWRRGTPMLDFTHYSANLLYLLGADPPPTILVSVGGYRHADDMARLTLAEARRVDRDRWAGAWLLTMEEQRAGFAPDPALVRILGRRFPADYRRVGTFDGPDGRFAMWEPVAS